jgi:hypothetical protein
MNASMTNVSELISDLIDDKEEETTRLKRLFSLACDTEDGWQCVDVWYPTNKDKTKFQLRHSGITMLEAFCIFKDAVKAGGCVGSRDVPIIVQGLAPHQKPVTLVPRQSIQGAE